MLSSLKQRFKRLPSKEKSQVIILTVCVLVSAYGFVAASLWQQMFEAEKLANRKENRITTRIGKIEEPKFERDISEVNLQALKKKLTSSEEEITQLTAKFINSNNAEKIQTLKLAISELADDVNVEILDFQTINAKRKAHEEELSEYKDIRQQYYQRPHFVVQAQSNYYGLLYFIETLQQLDNIAIVNQLTVEYQGSGLLKISMRILV